MTTDDELALLDEDAHTYAPAMFALYGVYHRQDVTPGQQRPPFLGWGLEFLLPQKAILWIAGGETWHSDSAESILKRYQTIADVRLVWLSDDPDGGPYAEDYDLASD